MRAVRTLAVAGFLALAATSAQAQCGNCPGAELPARVCSIPATVQTGTGCPGFKNCQVPILKGTRIDVVETGAGTYEARLVADVEAPWNSDPSTFSFLKLHLYWSQGATAEPFGHGAAVRYRAGGAGGPGWPGTAAWNQVLGRYWSHEYAERIVPDPDAAHVWLITGHATFREFTDANADGAYETASPSDEHRDLIKVPSGWELRSLDGTVQSFDTAGLWTGTMDRNGNETAAQYASGRLTRVTFPDGRREDFAYHPDGKLHTITQAGVDGTTSRTWTYTWSGLDLIRIDRPDGTAWEMFYSSDPNLGGYLTRLDLRGGGGGTGRVETAWEYDAKGNVTRIWRGDPSWNGPNAVDLHVLSYDSPALPKHTEVADALGNVSVYDMQRDPSSRKPRMTGIQGDCPSCGLGPATTFEYGDTANPLLPTGIVDAKGHRTEMVYNADGRLVSRIEAANTPLARETAWEYHPVFRAFPTRIEVPSTAGGLALRETLMSYDAEGNLISRTEQGMEDGAAFALTTVMTYNAGGQVLTVDPPGHGAADVTAYAYDATRGNGHLVPLSRTDPIVGTTVFAHDAFNRRTGVIDVNGVPTVTTYDNLDRVTSVAQDDLVTSYAYDAFGDLFRTTHPEGNLLEYDFDSAGRLQSVESRPDAATRGERTFYTLDAVGHRVREDLQSWDGSEWQTESWTEYVYGSKCHLDKVIRPGGSVTEYAYDCKGNLEKVWDANHPKASNGPTQLYAYDALDRLTSLTQPWTGAGGGTAVTSYTYDVQDHLASVTDAEGNITLYTYSDRDLLTRQDSPVSGVTTYVYNEHGDLEEETDARGVTVTRAYDVLDRATTVSYPDPSLDVTYTYDAPGAKGRLKGIERHGETIVYEYDRVGRMTRDGALTYGYDDNGNKTTIGYPNDVTATYTYDHAGRQQTLSMTVGTDPAVALVTDAKYKPFGPLSSLSLGNGLIETRDYDARYQPSTIRVDGASPLLHWAYTIDPVGNITGITDQLNPANNRTFGYQDVFYYLTQGDGPWGPRAWTYDRIGNRLAEARGPETDVYSYLANAGGGHNPKLVSVATAGGGERTYGYDEAGNTVQIVAEDSQQDLIYDGAGRMAFLRWLPEEKIATFMYDARDYLLEVSRTEAICPGGHLLAFYSSDGLLRARQRTLGAEELPAEVDVFFYFAGQPVVIAEKLIASQSLTFVHTDYLGVPLLSSGLNGTVVWFGGFSPFGGDWAGAADAGVLLGPSFQWQDTFWEGSFGDDGQLSTSGSSWAMSSLGRVLAADDELYYVMDPIVSDSQARSAGPLLTGIPEPPAAPLEAHSVNSPWARVVCDCNGGFKWIWIDRPEAPYLKCVESCAVRHEEDHLKWLRRFKPLSCQGKKDGDNPAITQEDRACSECSAFKVSFKCLKSVLARLERRAGSAHCQFVARRELQLHENRKAKECGECDRR